jgi:uncharacterized membrane protein YjdF
MNLLAPGKVALLLFTFAYVIGGAVFLLKAGNTEFLTYLIALVPLVAVAFYLQAKFELPLWMLWLVSILFALHLAGGSIYVHGDVLYNYILISIPNWTGLTIWKFDQLVHPYGAAAFALCAHYLLATRSRFARITVVLLAFLIANGFGALNEVIEFGMKILTPHTDVGGYYNTGLDLVFNMLGALIGSLLGVFITRPKS